MTPRDQVLRRLQGRTSLSENELLFGAGSTPDRELLRAAIRELLSDGLIAVVPGWRNTRYSLAGGA